MAEQNTDRFPAAHSRDWGSRKGLSKEMDIIASFYDVSPRLRRGFTAKLFQRESILEEYLETCWSKGKTPAGQDLIKADIALAKLVTNRVHWLPITPKLASIKGSEESKFYRLVDLKELNWF